MWLKQTNNRRGEAIVNGAENSFFLDAKARDLDAAFFKPDNLGKQFSKFREKVREQIDGARAGIESELKKDSLDPDAFERVLRNEGFRSADDIYNTQLKDRFEDIYFGFSEDPAEFKHQVRALMDNNLPMPSDDELLHVFTDGLSEMKATRVKNDGLLTRLAAEKKKPSTPTQVMIDDARISKDLLNPSVEESRSGA